MKYKSYIGLLAIAAMVTSCSQDVVEDSVFKGDEVFATLPELEEEFKNGIVLKMVSEDGRIIGSVRSYAKDKTVYIGKLMVHPDFRGKGYGSKLLREIECYYADKRYELFTSTKSVDNIRLYEKLGYKIFDEKKITDELVFVYMEKMPV